jgi:hypothetical protein
MESIISDTNHELDQKIKEKKVPTHDDKKRIQQRIKQLEKKQQLHLFKTVVRGLGTKVYSVTENGTYFDLNDLTPEQFWKLSYHINLTYDCINRHKLINELEKQCPVYNQEMDIESNSMWDTYEPNDVELDSNVISSMNYSQLRDEALSHCRYSDFYKKENDSAVSKLTDHESKVIERNIYTDRRLTSKIKKNS